MGMLIIKFDNAKWRDALAATAIVDVRVVFGHTMVPCVISIFKQPREHMHANHLDMSSTQTVSGQIN